MLITSEVSPSSSAASSTSSVLSFSSFSLLGWPSTYLSQPLTSLHSTTPLLILPIIAIASEVLSSYTYALYLKLVHLWRLRRKDVQSQQEGAQYFTPALNLEHTIERTNLFITLVLGEMILK